MNQKDISEKAALRRSLLTQRQAMSTDEWRYKSDRLCTQLQTVPSFQQSTTILAYMSVRHEPDLSPLISARASAQDPHAEENRRWGFPRCVGKTMDWHEWSPHHGLPLEKGAFGILEPNPQSPTVEAEQVDLILVPAVACDRQGYRLGYGGGFYDRMFSTPKWRVIPTIGIVFSSLLVETLPIDPWDHPLKAICTDEEWLSFE